MSNKYRIKVTKYESGKSMFVPQYKFLFMWFSYGFTDQYDNSHISRYETLEKATAHIDKERGSKIKSDETYYVDL